MLSIPALLSAIVGVVLFAPLVRCACLAFNFLGRQPVFDQSEDEADESSKVPPPSNPSETEVLEPNLAVEESPSPAQIVNPSVGDLENTNPYSAPQPTTAAKSDSSEPSGVPTPSWGHSFGIAVLWAICYWVIDFVFFGIQVLARVYDFPFPTFNFFASAAIGIVVLVLLLNSMLPTRLPKASKVAVLFVLMFIAARAFLHRLGVLGELAYWMDENNFLTFGTFLDFVF